jgi:ribosomal protein S18 acetylase RimI-like enzyme
MENAQVMKLIDSGANFYCRQLGNASHMQFERREYYSIIYPKPGEQERTSVFDVTVEFVATLPQFRRLGIAKSVCESAVDEAFAGGSKVITTAQPLVAG